MTLIGGPGDDLAVLVARILTEPLDDEPGRRRRRPVLDQFDRRSGRSMLRTMRLAASYEARPGEPRYWLHLLAERDALATNIVRGMVSGNFLPPSLIHTFAVLDRALSIRTAWAMSQITEALRQ